MSTRVVSDCVRADCTRRGDMRSHGYCCPACEHRYLATGHSAECNAGRLRETQGEAGDSDRATAIGASNLSRGPVPQHVAPLSLEA